jgi:L-alanine-DL-glutamate epimerase-like enolase superfamily enzyme
MRISKVETFVLLEPHFNVNSTSSAQDDLVVAIHTDDGFIGYGETDLNPWIARACIEAPGTHTMGLGLRQMLLGKDPLEVEAIWEVLYTGSAMNGRRGAMIHAMGAVDIALHDLRGKILGKPCCQLFADEDDSSPKTTIRPYASLQPEVTGFKEYAPQLIEYALRAQALGFRAAKVEITPFGPYAHRGLKASPEEMTELLREVRRALGDSFKLMIDVQYAFADADACLRTIRNWVDLDLFFIETPLPSDDLAGYARLTEEQPIPIAAGEWLATRYEFLDLIDRGKVAVVQPDVGRVGGLTEARRVARLAGERGRTIVPHVWKTGLSIAAAAHLAAVTPHCPLIEYLPSEFCNSALRSRLVKQTPELKDGELQISNRPGLGIEVDLDALREFEKAAVEQTRKDDSLQYGGRNHLWTSPLLDERAAPGRR